MSDINKVDVVLGGNADLLKAAAITATEKIRILKTEIASAGPTAKEFFHEMHAGALTATGSLRGLGMAASATGAMLPIVAFGVLFEVLKKFEVFKELFGGVTDALRITSIATDELIKEQKIRGDYAISELRDELTLTTALGGSVDDIFQNKLALAKKEWEVQKELLYLKAAGSKKDQEYAKAGGEGEAKLHELKTNYLAIENIQNKSRYEKDKGYLDQIMLLKSKGLKHDLDEIEIWYAAESKKYPTDYVLYLLYQAKIDSAKEKYALKDSNRDQKAHDDARGQRNKFLVQFREDHKKAMDAVHNDMVHGEGANTKVLEESEKERASNVKEVLSEQVRAARELSQVFDSIFKGGKDGWKGLEDSMISFFEKMISEVLGAIAVYAILDILSGGAPMVAGGGKIGLGGFIKKTLGFASGTDFAPGGMAVVGEYGPELVNLPKGSQVFNNTQTTNMMNGGGAPYILTHRVSGSDLLIVMERAAIKKGMNT